MSQADPCMLIGPAEHAIKHIPIDYALAYAKLSRHIAAIEAMLRTRSYPESEIREEIDAAMTAIRQIEKP